MQSQMLPMLLSSATNQTFGSILLVTDGTRKGSKILRSAKHITPTWILYIKCVLQMYNVLVHA